MAKTDNHLHALIRAQNEADVEEIAEATLARITGAERSAFMRPVNGAIVTSSCKVACGQGPHQQRALVDGIIDSAFSKNEAERIDDLTNTRSAAGSQSGASRVYRSLLCEPVDEWGILVAADTDQAAFDQTTHERVRRLASGVDAALERIQSADGRDISDEDHSAIVAHDLRNPLQVAIARLEMVQHDCDHDQLPTVARSLERMQNLIDDLLMASAKDRQATDLQDVDLPSAVQTSWQNVHTPEATLENQTHGIIRADPAQLQQLLENLFGNAIEHAGETVTVTVGSLIDGFYLEDDGPGIPTEKRTTVFDTGFSTERGGSGLGLAIAEQIVENHGWDVTITDGTDGGARFEIRGIEHG